MDEMKKDLTMGAAMAMTLVARERTAEMVTDGHPDKACDQMADAVLDAHLATDPKSRVALEMLAKDNLVIYSGEVTSTAAVNVATIAGDVWERRIGYGPSNSLTVINFVQQQSPDIAHGGGHSDDGGVDFGGAGDQGIMVGYATDETPEMMPLEYVHARNMARRLRDLRRSGGLPWLRPDGKTQVTIVDGRVTSVVVAAHHDATISMEEVRAELRAKVVEPTVGPDVPRVVINGTGAFTIGGPHGDAGVVGRKIVVDAYGPRVPVGGGAYSGKDPTKVDRSAAYMARHIAKAVVAEQVAGARQCLVALAYGIGQRQPEMVTAFTDSGADVSAWVRDRFRDLAPASIIEYLGLRRPSSWSYFDTASFGHYGRPEFPWEQVGKRM